MYLRDFTAAGASYCLHHNTDDDSRHVTRLSDHTARVLLRIDSNLRFTDALGHKVGYITSRGLYWVLHRQGLPDVVLCPHRDHDWRTLEHAECIAAGFILAGQTSQG